MLPCLVPLLWAATPPIAPASDQALARAIFQELVEIDTTDDKGSTTAAAQAVARRLRADGWPEGDVQVLGPSPRKGNLVARLHGTGHRRPLLLLGHLDVVVAHREDWSLDPFKLTEQGGYFYGRGTEDMKGQVALWVAAVMRLRRDKQPLDRDVIVALTADEENGPENGVQWLLAHHRPLIDAAFALNEGAGGEIKDGRYRSNDVQPAEKGFLSFHLETRNKGGHSSLPDRDNAIVHLADALGRIHRHQFPARLIPVTRAYFARVARLERGQTALDMYLLGATRPDRALDAEAVARLSLTPFFNARLRTTCVPTLIEGGHAENALPQRASATVNCRLLPGDTPEEVRAALVAAAADPAVSITPVKPLDAAPASPLIPELTVPLERVTEEMWPGVVVLPVMVPGATDGRFLRAAGIPTYGVSGLFHDVDDVRAHGRDERIPVRSFQEAQEFLYRLVRALVTPG